MSKYHVGRKAFNIKGKKFGRWKVIEQVIIPGKTHGRESVWICLCECGSTKIVRSTSLRSGESKSCGCLRKELNIKRYTKHGLMKTRFYHCFMGAKFRCINPRGKDYKRYGGRGIKMLWVSMVDFKKDMYKSYLKHVGKYGEKDTQLDRIDVNGNYCKENCRWVTCVEQGNNRRNNHLRFYRGRAKTSSEWAKLYGLKTSTLEKRLDKYQLSMHEALTRPIRAHLYKKRS